MVTEKLFSQVILWDISVLLANQILFSHTSSTFSSDSFAYYDLCTLFLNWSSDEREENIWQVESDRKRNYYYENCFPVTTLQQGHSQQVCVTSTVIMHSFNGRR